MPIAATMVSPMRVLARSSSPPTRRKSRRSKRSPPRAFANGVDDVERLDAAEARRLEPELHCVAALWSPSTGIVDSHALMLAYLGEAEAAGAMIVLRTPIVAGTVRADGFELSTGGDEPDTIRCRYFVNAAGLYAPALAHAVEASRARRSHPLISAAASTSRSRGKTPFHHLVYPVPPPGGLGVHITLDLAGQARFGPDVEWISSVDYSVDPERGEAFYAAVRRYWPGLRDGALQPGYAGIRPKISGPTEPAADFVVQGPENHGVPGLINLYGIESPGLTASLALADEVTKRLTET